MIATNIIADYKETQEKAARIIKWLPDYIRTFNNQRKFDHLFNKHVNVSDEAMKKRAIQEKKSVSSFLGNEDDILQLMTDTLLDTAEEIAEYLADPVSEQEPWEIWADIPSHIGGIMFKYGRGHNWNDGPLVCDKFAIIIAKKRGTNGFYIKSCYPIDI